MSEWKPSQGQRCEVSGVVYSPRYPRWWDAWTVNQCTPLWARVRSCEHAAVIALLHGSRPDDTQRAVRRTAIRIAGQAQNCRAYQSASEALNHERQRDRWMTRHSPPVLGIER